jgi:peptide/nickel transport system substrate-binding protein
VLTAELVEKTLRKASRSAANRVLYPTLSDIVEVKASGASELVIQHKRPSALLLDDLDVPLSFDTAKGAAGSGAYRVLSEGDEETILEAHPQYYLGAPRVARVIIRPFDALRAAWVSLLRGDIDMVTNVPHDALEFLDLGQVQVQSFLRPYQFLIAFNSAKPPFTSPVVRRALNSAIDRAELINRVLKGRGLAATGPLWPQHWAYDRELPQYSYDPSLAVSTLEAAGYEVRSATATSGRPPARLRFTCLIPANFSVTERLALEIQKQLYDIGVDMQIEAVPVEKYDVMIRDGAFDAVMIDMISGQSFGRAFQFWRSARTFKGLNVFHYDNPEADRWFEALGTATNEAAARSAASQLHRSLLLNPPALFIAWNERARPVSRRFQVNAEAGRDPLYTIWQWNVNTAELQASR